MKLNFSFLALAAVMTAGCNPATPAVSAAVEPAASATSPVEAPAVDPGADAALLEQIKKDLVGASVIGCPQKFAITSAAQVESIVIGSRDSTAAQQVLKAPATLAVESQRLKADLTITYQQQPDQLWKVTSVEAVNCTPTPS